LFIAGDRAHDRGSEGEEVDVKRRSLFCVPLIGALLFSSAALAGAHHRVSAVKRPKATQGKVYNRNNLVPTSRLVALPTALEPGIALGFRELPSEASVRAWQPQGTASRAAASEGVAPPMPSVTTAPFASHGVASRFPALGSEPPILDAQGEREFAGAIGKLIVRLD
jgi:hypothetical protein